MTKLLFLLLLAIGCGESTTKKVAKEKNIDELSVSERKLFGIRMFMNFNYLPREGEVSDKSKFWSGSSWQLINGSINYRWNSPRREGRFTPPPHPRNLSKLTQEELNTLSPSEKYDLWMGRYDYPLKYEVDRNLPTSPLSWEGLCHGWAGASLNYSEPKPKTFINPDGLIISFGSSDIKALLSYYYSKLLVPDEDQVGIRCDKDGHISDNFCDDDVTPVEFHTILVNKVALRGDSFVTDIDRYREVWNHPIVSFESEIVGDERLSLMRIVHMKTTLRYVDVIEKNTWGPIIGTGIQQFSKIQYEYELHLDLSGNMVSGMWLSRNRPDFIWTIGKVKKFEGYLSGLSKLTAP